MSPPPAARLVALTALVVALAAAVLITGERRGGIERPLLAPGLDAAAVRGVVIARPGAPDVVVEVGDGGARVIAPVPGPADDSAVRDLVSALATARADRVLRGADARRRAGLESPALRVRLERAGAPPLEVARGAALASSGQVWLGVGERVVLAPAWVGDALDRDLASLRRRRPFAPGPVTGIELHGDGVDLVLAGEPLRRRDEGAGVRVARAARAALDGALGALVLDVLVTGELAPPRLTVRVLGGTAPAELEVHGPCPGHADHDLVSGSAGVGCVARAALDAVLAAGRRLASPDGILTAPLEGELVAIAAGDVRLARRGAGWELVVGAVRTAADDDAAAALLAALGRAGTLRPPPPTPPDARWQVTLGGGAVEAWAWWWQGGAAVLRRDDEPVALELDAAVAAAARGLGAGLRERTVLTVEPTAIAAVRAQGAAPAELVRGALIGEWRVQVPAGAVATPAVAALVDAVSLIRASAWLGDAPVGAIRRTVTLTLDAPPVAGAGAEVHTIAVGGARPGGACAARIDALPPVELAAATCAALLAPLVAR